MEECQNHTGHERMFYWEINLFSGSTLKERLYSGWGQAQVQGLERKRGYSLKFIWDTFCFNWLVGMSSLANHLSGKERESGASTSGFCFVLFCFVSIWLHGVLVAACGMFNHGMQGLVPWLGLKPGSPALGVPSLNHWTTREVPVSVFIVGKHRGSGETYMFCGEEGSYSKWFSKMCKSGEIS